MADRSLHIRIGEPFLLSLIDDIQADLTGTNELSDGTRDYREEDGVLYLDLYDNDAELDEDGFPVPSRTFRLQISIQEVPHATDQA